MKTYHPIVNNLSRREFVAGAAALAATSMAPKWSRAQATPNSSFEGVQIGAITYSFRSMPGSAQDLLNYCIECGISSVELMGGPAEAFAGAPEFERLSRPRGAQATEEALTAYNAKRREQDEILSEWRQTVSMDKYAELRKMYNDAGVGIHIVKLGDINGNMPKEEIEYCFNVARTLGARGITTEISEEKAKALGPYADKHEIMIGFHNHTQVNASSWEKPFSYGKYLGMNFDIGHYVAGTNESPLPIIERYAPENRILSLHIKDRKVNNGPNMPLGMGDTPVALVLQWMKKNNASFPADIELEYSIPEGSNAVKEVKKCVYYSKNVLTS
jgi:sugar phosphate isomerase/epimerase